MLHTSNAGASGIRDTKKDDNMLAVFPNSTQSSVTIRFSVDDIENVSITIHDVSGKLLFTKALNNVSGENSLVVNTSEFAGGVYFIQMRSDNILKQAKLVVSH